MGKNKTFETLRKISDFIVVIALISLGFITWGETPKGREALKIDKSEDSIEKAPIIIEYPLPNSRVSGYVQISGKALVSGNHLYLRIIDPITKSEVWSDTIEALPAMSPDYSMWNYSFNSNNLKDGKRYLIELSGRTAGRGEVFGKVVSPIIIWRDTSTPE